MVVFEKITFKNLPEVYKDAIISFESDRVELDDVKVAAMTQAQRDKGLEWLTANGFKQV